MCACIPYTVEDKSSGKGRSECRCHEYEPPSCNEKQLTTQQLSSSPLCAHCACPGFLVRIHTMGQRAPLASSLDVQPSCPNRHASPHLSHSPPLPTSTPRGC